MYNNLKIFLFVLLLIELLLVFAILYFPILNKQPLNKNLYFNKYTLDSHSEINLKNQFAHLKNIKLKNKNNSLYKCYKEDYCIFKNLYYDKSKKEIFVLIQNYQLNEFKNNEIIITSTTQNFNIVKYKIKVYNPFKYNLKDLTSLYNEKLLIFMRRHQPFNLYHGLKDWIHRLYPTINLLFNSNVDKDFYKYILTIYYDNNADKNVNKLFKDHFSSKLVLKEHLSHEFFNTIVNKHKNNIICFENVIFGNNLKMDLDIYKNDYSDNIKIQLFNNFKKFILLKNKISYNSLVNTKFQILIISRKNAVKRKLDNEKLLENTIKQDICIKYNCIIKIQDMSELSILEQIKLFRNSKIIISLHGAALTWSLFLDKNQLVIELFPFGLNKRHFYKYIFKNFVKINSGNYQSVHLNYKSIVAFPLKYLPNTNINVTNFKLNYNVIKHTEQFKKIHFNFFKNVDSILLKPTVDGIINYILNYLK